MLTVVHAITHTSAFSVAPLGLLGGWLFVRRQRRLENPMLDVDPSGAARAPAPEAADVISSFALVGLLFFSQYLAACRRNGLQPFGVGCSP